MAAPGTVTLLAILDACRQEEIEFPAAAALHVVTEAIKDLDYSPGSALDSGLWGRVVHGDIRPGSVRVGSDGAITLAHPADHWGWEMEQLRYAAPEVAGGEGAGPRSDIFALGALLFELLSGEPVYPHEGPEELAVALSEGFDPTTRVPGVAGALAATAPFVSRALAARPEDRYPAADVFLEDLLTVLRGLAGPPPREQLAALVERVRPSIPPPRAGLPADAPAELSLPGVAAAFDAVEAPLGSLADGPDWDPIEAIEASEAAGADSWGDLSESGEAMRHPWSDDTSLSPAPWERDVQPQEPSADLEPRGGSDGVSGDASAAGQELFDPHVLDLAEVTDGPAEPSAASCGTPLGGGAYLFTGGQVHGPLTLLEMEPHLARLRDPGALVAFEKGAWRPLSECGALLPGRAPRLERRSFHLFELGPTLLELGAGPYLRRITLWHDEDAAALEVAEGQVWESHAASVPSMARELLREEDLLSTEDLGSVEITGDDTRTLNALRHRGLLTAGQVARLLRRRARRTLAAPFGWPHGELSIRETRRRPRASSSGVDLAQAIAFIVRSHGDPALVEGLFHQMRDKNAVPVSPSLEHQQPLMPAEERFLAELPPNAPLSQALGSFWDEGREGAFAALFLCVELGLVRLEQGTAAPQ